jgi:predicted nucleic acid-binding protein
MRVVFNTSPLIFLSKLNYLEKALSSFDSIFIPKTVNEEISSKEDKTKSQINNCIELRQIEIKESSLRKLYEALNKKFGEGESEAIALAVEMDLDLAILDDFAARKQASDLGIKVKGTLGIIKKLAEENEIVIDDIEELYRRTIEIGLWIDKNIFYEIFKELK